MSLIQALFCDMDETLTADNASISQSIQQVIPVIQRHYEHLETQRIYETYCTVNRWHWEHYDESPIRELSDSIEVRALILREVLREFEIDDGDLAEEVAREFEGWREKTYRCYEDTIPVLQSLCKTLPIVLVTNGNSSMQRGKIQRCGLEPYLKAVVIAQEIGESKPAAKPFEKALEAVGVEPGYVLMVGDHLEKDIGGAKNVGCRTAWMVRNGTPSDNPKPKPDFTVQNMNEVKKIVECS